MKRTEPTVSLLARNPDGSFARQYVPSHMTDIRKSWRMDQDNQRAAFESVSDCLAHSSEAQRKWHDNVTHKWWIDGIDS
jgi:hypothetical protein